MLTAYIEIGFSSSRLLILDSDGRGPCLNLVWGRGVRGARSPRERAEALLTQNGYRRIGDWAPARHGRGSALVEALPPTTACSCWRDDAGRLVEVDYRCGEHPDKREKQGIAG